MKLKDDNKKYTTIFTKNNTTLRVFDSKFRAFFQTGFHGFSVLSVYFYRELEEQRIKEETEFKRREEEEKKQVRVFV